MERSHRFMGALPRTEDVTAPERAVDRVLIPTLARVGSARINAGRTATDP